MGFLGGRVCIVTTPRDGWGLEMDLATQHSKMDARSWGDASSQTFQSFLNKTGAKVMLPTKHGTSQELTRYQSLKS